jgi:hypothetical protein
LLEVGDPGDGWEGISRAPGTPFCPKTGRTNARQSMNGELVQLVRTAEKLKHKSYEAKIVNVERLNERYLIYCIYSGCILFQ